MTKSVDKVSVTGDSRIQRRSATINQKSYGYLLAEPTESYTHTIFLIHGFPDLSMGWRYQIPFLLNLGLRVVCPDCIGYGRSDSPTCLAPYTWKSQCEDFHELARQLGCESILLGGHDWGAMLAYRFALYFPRFVTHLVTFVVPYGPPLPEYHRPQDLVKRCPDFGYQIQFGSEDGVIERRTQDRKGIRLFLNGLYGGSTPDGKYAFDAVIGVDFDLLPHLSPTKLLDDEELQFYVEEYSRKGLRGPCNYYRTAYQNFVDELRFLTTKDGESVKIKCPTLFFQATRDKVISQQMVEEMEIHLPQLTIERLRSSHWILWEQPGKVNELLGTWLLQQGVIHEF